MKDSNLHIEFIKTARRLGNKTAIDDAFGDKQYTFSRVLIAALVISKQIRSIPESHIGMMVPNSAGGMIVNIATLMSGKIPVMINFSTHAQANIEYAQKKCNLKDIITSKKLLEKIGCPELPGMLFAEEMVKNVGKTDKVKGLIKSKLPLKVLQRLVSPRSADDTAVILLTSGSEKDPKVVQLTHMNILSNISGIQERFQFQPNDSVLAILPYFHIFGFNTNLWFPLTLGFRAVTYPNPLHFKRIVTIAKDYKPTVIVGTPYFLMGYLRHAEEGDFEYLQMAIVGADTPPPSLCKTYKDVHQVELYEGYGATETSPVISCNSPGMRKMGSIGKPIRGMEVRIVDINTGEDLPHGQEGNLLVKGTSVMKGYFDDFEETHLRIRDGWYDTGDLGMFDEEGFLWHRGRLKRFVKIAGEMVSLVRVEKACIEILPDHVDCCIVSIPDALKGGKIIAVVSEPIQERKILSKLKKSLPPLFMPKQFIVLPDIPKLGSGKVDFKGVREKVLASL